MNTALIDAETARRRTVPTAALQRIELPRQHARGALEGAGLGAVAGALVGAMLGFLSGDDRCPPTGWCFFSLTAAQKAEGGAIVLGAGGLLIGTIIGAIAGHTTVLEFDPPPPPPRGN